MPPDKVLGKENPQIGQKMPTLGKIYLLFDQLGQILYTLSSGIRAQQFLECRLQ